MRLTLFAMLLPLALRPAAGADPLVAPGPDGKLVYRTFKMPGATEDRGDRVPDYSWCGYKANAVPIPDAPVALRLAPQPGDNRAALQAALDKLAAMPMAANGLRGALLLAAGEYRIEGTVGVRASGIVIRGAGSGADGTRLIATQRKQHTLIQFSGSDGPVAGGKAARITDAYVPVGTRSLRLAAGHGLKAGDAVLVRVAPNPAWIDLLGMAPYGWTAGDYAQEYKRNVVAVAGNAITLDAPIVDPIDAKYAAGTVSRYAWPGKIENCGIEDLRLISEYQGEEDEQHGWNAVVFSRIQDAWMRRVEADHFGYSAVTVGEDAYRVTVLDCASVDPISQTTGGRKYSFNVTGQQVLVMGCRARNGRHDFVTGARVPGPNAFVRCSADSQRADMGPHHRWATGLLFDGISGDGALNVQNREASGSGHGWAGAQCLFWNCKVKDMVVQSPPGHVNWSIGCVGGITGKGAWYTAEAAYVESAGQPVVPVSLFDQQLRERLGASGIRSLRGSGDGRSLLRPLGGDRWSLRFPGPGNYTIEALDAMGRTRAVARRLDGNGGTAILRIPGADLPWGARVLLRDAEGRPLAVSGPATP